MPTRAITADYHGDMKDTQDKFHGNQLINILWDQHLMFGWPMCVPVAPEMPFGAVVEKVIPQIFSAHPDFAKIDWNTVTWRYQGKPFTPDPAKSIKDNGLKHKATIAFTTPGLTGVGGSGT